ncbi:MAG TPA: hypothetical protein VFC61_04575 [Blastocatellia bacterium]|nr:hypothetical protein [Blastocatellia bacterium]
MKTYSLMIMIALFAVAFATVPVRAAEPAAQQAQPKFGSDEERAAYEAFFNEKDPAKKVALAKAFGQKYSTSEYKKYTDAAVLNGLGAQFQQELKAFYDGPDSGKLDKLLATGEEYLTLQPGQPYVSTHMALAAGFGVLSQKYTNIDKAMGYADKALPLLETTTPPAGYDAAQWTTLRTTGLSSLPQYQGLYYTKKEPMDAEKAIAALTKAAEFKEGPASKDPNTYWLRASAYNTQYETLSKEYRAMADDQKTGEAGKAVLAKVDPVVDKMIEDYGRVYVLSASNAQAAQLRSAAKELLDNFWKYRNNGKLDGQAEYLKQVEANPTGSNPPKFAAAPSSNEVATGVMPTANTKQPSLNASQPSGNGSKAAPAKTSKASKGKKRR